MARRRDTHTVDLFREYQPTPVVERFQADAVKGWSHQARLSRAVALTMDQSGMSRDAIATAMTEILQAPVSKAMLDSYAAPAREQHSISAIRLVALIQVTGDARALNALLEGAGLIAIPKKYEALILREVTDEVIEKATRDRQAFDAEWKAKR